MITQVQTPALYAGVIDVVSNASTTAGVVAGGAPMMGATLPAGTDEASVLASGNTSLHAANFVGVAATAAMLLGVQYGGQLGSCAFNYDLVDGANAMSLV